MNPHAMQVARALERGLGDPDDPRSAISYAAALELDEAEAFPQAGIGALHRLGCFEQLIPAAAGGELDDPEQAMLVSRLVSRRDLTVAVAFGQTLLGSIPVWLAGSAVQQSELAAVLRAGGLGCLALTEKEHGSDILSSCFSAQPVAAGGYTLHGAKWLINNGRRGGVATVLARIERGADSSELGLLWLRRPGMVASPATWHSHDKIRTHGIRGADISGFRLEGHACGAEALLRGSEPALYTVLKTLQISRILCAGFSLGAADTMFRLVLRFARERRLYGRQVTELPAARARLAACWARLLVADLVAQAACRAIAARPGELSLLSAIAKFQVPGECEAVARELAIVLGARHYVRSEPPWGTFQKMMRDNQVVSLFDGSAEVNLGLVASQLKQVASVLRHKLEAGAANDDGHAAQQLLWRDGGCRGWPRQEQLQLSARGQDRVLGAYVALRTAPPGDAPPQIEAALAALDRRLHGWLQAVREACERQRLAPDSVRVMTLAREYITLHAAAVAVLAWQLHRGLPACRIGDDLLLEYLTHALPEAGIELDEARHARLLEAAVQTVEGGWLISAIELRLGLA